MALVYFATNREPIGSPQTTDFGPGAGARSAILFGRATVADASANADENQNLVLDNLSTGTFWTPLQQEIVHGASGHLLVYLHGFDYTFRQTIVRVAQVNQWYGKATPPLPSTVLCLCWPSLGRLTLDSYATDFDRATGAGDAFRQFLRALVPIITAFRASRSGRRVSLLAHSMGNHVLTAGLQSALGTRPGQYNPRGQAALFDTAVLAASDEDADALSHDDKLGPLASIVRRIAVYYNEQDIPLTTISRWVHHCARLGVNGPPDKPSFRDLAYSFVNCSVASPVSNDGTPLDPERHQYYRLVPEVRNDICGVMSGRADNALPNRVYRPDDNYYRLNLARASALVA